MVDLNSNNLIAAVDIGKRVYNQQVRSLLQYLFRYLAKFLRKVWLVFVVPGHQKIIEPNPWPHRNMPLKRVIVGVSESVRQCVVSAVEFVPVVLAEHAK